MANVREVLQGKVCQLILSPIVPLSHFLFKKSGRGESGDRGYRERDPREVGGQGDAIGRTEKSRKWPSSKRRESGRNRGKLLNDVKYCAIEKRLNGGSKEKRGWSQKCKAPEKKEK